MTEDHEEDFVLQPDDLMFVQPEDQRDYDFRFEKDPSLTIGYRARAPRPAKVKIAAVGSTPMPSALDAFLKQMSQYDLLTKAEERDLALRKDAGDERAAELLALHNLRMVVSVAKRYMRNIRGANGITTMDLIQEGMPGLMRAVDRYDVHSGYRFSTYAMWWIRQSVGKGLAEKSRVIRVPMHVVEKRGKIGKAELELVTLLGRDPTPKEIAAHMDLPEEKVLMILRNTQVPISLDMKVKEGDTEHELLSKLADSASESPPGELLRSERDEVLSEAISKLAFRERRILELRFGYNDSEIEQAKNIARQFNITPERMRQIEAGALRKLRDMESIQALG